MRQVTLGVTRKTGLGRCDASLLTLDLGDIFRVISGKDIKEAVISMSNPVSSRSYTSSDITPGFLRKVEDELSRRLGERVLVVLGDGIVAAQGDSGLPAGKSAVVVTGVGPLLSRRQPAAWADVLERKINGEPSERAEDVEHLFAEIQKSPSAEQTGAIVLSHVDDYDDEFFEALAEVIARDKAHRRFARAGKFEALRQYLREVRRRACKGETSQMWAELARGAAREQDLKAPQG
jgi:hypothetical protein